MPAPVPTFTAAELKAAYQLRYHFGWYSHGRQPLFRAPAVRDTIAAGLTRVAEQHGYHLLEWELEPNVLRALISLRPDQAPVDVTRLVKGNIARDVRKRQGSGKIWSRGWFVRSNGDVTDDVIRAYVQSQFEHHRAAPGDFEHLTALCRFHDPADVTELRKTSHGVFEYNVHFVLVVRRRCELLDPNVSGSLVEFWRRVCERKDWRLWDVEVVWNHAHLFVGLSPADTPEAAALSLMNNSEYFLTKRYGAAIASERLEGIWRPGFYAGTAGAATTSQIRAYLERQMDVD